MADSIKVSSTLVRVRHPLELIVAPLAMHYRNQGLQEIISVRTHIVSATRIALLLTMAAAAASAQQPSPNSAPAGHPSVSPSSITATVPQTKPPQVHRFWDRENDLLFAGVAAARGMDYSSTLNLRRRGDDEVLLDNQIVDNHPLFAGIEAAGTMASIGLSYLFHRTGHHALERWTSIVHIGLTVGGALRNYNLPTQHPN